MDKEEEEGNESTVGYQANADTDTKHLVRVIRGVSQGPVPVTAMTDRPANEKDMCDEKMAESESDS